MENLRQQIAAMRQSFFDEEILDKQFYQLEYLEKSGNPNFVEEVLTIYFRESTILLQTVEQAMEAEPIEPVKVDRMLYKLKGSSGRAKAAFQELRNEHGNLREKLELYFQHNPCCVSVFGRAATEASKPCMLGLEVLEAEVWCWSMQIHHANVIGLLSFTISKRLRRNKLRMDVLRSYFSATTSLHTVLKASEISMAFYQVHLTYQRILLCDS
ncbi:hypothetical protein V6N12_032129 [Hibiscus sabdariffa]|uniref:Histidine-containing phosphotransfer protein n=1 Tax=Hibiscus sabdariffa TaxID=183260 RepID=A0ABR2CBR4_9ROSI